jgi:DNA invertase Pin-like site-specific DNA recombinase
MIYGYARISIGAQSLTGQFAQLRVAECEKVCPDKLMGATANRLEFRKLISALSYGDVAIIPPVDRLSRDTTNLLVIAREMQQAGVGIRSLAESLPGTTTDFPEIVFAVLGVAATLERGRSLERTAQAAPMRKAKGVNSDTSRSSRRISSGKHERGLNVARRSAALPAATTSIKRRFRGLAAQTGEGG